MAKTTDKLTAAQLTILCDIAAGNGFACIKSHTTRRAAGDVPVNGNALSPLIWNGWLERSGVQGQYALTAKARAVIG
jgi:hypothetical protein